MTAAVELARGLVRVDTVNPPGRERPAAELAAARLEAAGLDVALHELGPGRASVVARLGAGPALCLTGHLDVVPVGDEPWARDPFGGELDGDRLHGRGASDMKGGVAAIVAAVEAVAGGWPGAGAGLEVVLTAGEETGCEGARALVGAGVLGSVGAVVVAEPTANEPRVAEKGAVWLRATASGRAAHGSAPELGDNAVQALARAIDRLDGLAFDVAPHGVLGSPTLNVGTFHGGGAVNSVPDAAVAEVDVRTVPGLDAAAVAAAVGERLGADVELEVVRDLAPVETEPGDEWVAEVCDALATLLGERPELGGMAAFTDAALLTPAYGGPPTVICGPGEPDQAHRTDEWCSIARIDQAVELYAELARRWRDR